MGVVEDKRFERYGAKCLFFDRNGGVSTGHFASLNVSLNVGDKKENVLENIDIVKNYTGCNKLALLNQIHSNKIIEYDGNIYNADGIYTDRKNVFLGIRFADCIPIVLMDKEGDIIMALHAGWRGTKLEISKKGIEIMIEKGIAPDNILVSIGPHICGNCYEIQSDVACNFEDRFKIFKNNRIYLNLKEINIEQLIQAGVKKENIDSFNICTYENRNFFSFRRNGVCGRNIGGIIKN